VPGRSLRRRPGLLIVPPTELSLDLRGVAGPQDGTDGQEHEVLFPGCLDDQREETRGCHGYVPEEYILALYLYPLRIRAGDAYSKCIMRKRGDDISILSDKICKIISDPYSRYESQDKGIYKIINVLGPTEFR